jgi:TRAP-type C4-dicarboxylate transport system permease small subunit
MSTVNKTAEKGTLEKIGNALEKVIYPFCRYLAFVSMLAAMIMMFLVTTDVFLRRVLNSPILGAYEIEKLLLSVMVFFGISFVMSEKGHVIVDTLTRLYPRRLKNIAYSIAYFLSMLIMAAIVWFSIDYGMEMLRVGETSVLLKVLIAPFIFIVAFGSVVMFFVLLIQFIYAVAGVDEKAPPVGFW